jgi:RNA recognition motif-containing protein
MKIYVGNLPLTTTEKELCRTFESFGQVESTKIIKETGSGQSRFAFVEMPSVNEASSAIKGLNGKSLHGTILLVNEALKW